MTRRTKLHLPDYLPYLVNRVGAALVTRFSTEALERHGLSIVMWRVLVALSDLGPQRQIDLSALTSVDVSTLSRLVARMVQLGLVTRTRSLQSNREVVVALTAKAHALVGELIPVARELEKVAIAGLPASAVNAAKAALRHMHRNLESRSGGDSGARRQVRRAKSPR